MSQEIEHLSQARVSAYVDGELAAGEQEAVREHLQGCATCAVRALSETQLKAATARAGQRFQAPAESLDRFRAVLRQETAPPASQVSSWRRYSWAGLAAVALLAVSLAGWQQVHQASNFSAELLDQHLGSLSSAAVPQVISSDRHTVKPWFQGRLPFSFNLPEPGALPPDTILRGANLTYLEGKPAALLLFTIHKHQVSVFVVQRLGGPKLAALPGSREGFTLSTATTRDLELIAVSDVNPADLQALVASLVKVQSPT
jgi:anti-sigma factor RsiW